MVATFWESFFLFLIFLPLVMLWAFALVDIFRRDDISGAKKAAWVVAVILLPFFGTLLYLVLRKPGATPEERAALEETSREFATHYSPGDTATQLATLSELHDRGKLTDGEFAAEKARLLGPGARVSGTDETVPGTGATAPA